ncbi:amino acid permease [Amycolatopsis sp. NPDC059657]|uniref:amino acid permease n=1 Tax=Amycolatopsis sp. NPDC059657 TaxID=3346899 RepID=UPI00366DD23E
MSATRIDTVADGELSRSLSPRHLSMIAIGGVIGAGLFVGSGQAIKAAGPAVLITYVTTGMLVVLVMRMLGEMSTADPQTGSFSVYAERTFGRWAGFSVGWLYWWFWVVTIGVEATAGAVIVHRWIPGVPQWAWALILMVALTLTNLFSVKSYGEFEFWFAAIKVAAITVFLLLGIAVIVGLFPGTPSPGLTNLTGNGGFAPHGLGPVIAASFVVVFSYFGAEIASVAATETADPVNTVRKAVRSVLWRILIFYVGSIAIVVTLLPYDDASVSKSPYVAVLDKIGLPAAGTIMDAVVLTAVLSCLNSGLYSASRMAFSLSGRGDAPKSWRKISKAGVPQIAVLASTVVGFLTVALNFVVPDEVFSLMLNTSGAIALFVWLAIACAQLRMRRQLERESPERLVLKMWAFPYLTWVAIVAMVLLIVGMVLDDSGRPQALASLGLAVVVIAIGVVRQRRSQTSPSRSK